VEPEKPDISKKPRSPRRRQFPAGAEEAFEYDEIILEEEETTGRMSSPQSHFAPPVRRGFS
jgi:hypothetical protein